MARKKPTWVPAVTLAKSTPDPRDESGIEADQTPSAHPLPSLIDEFQQMIDLKIEDKKSLAGEQHDPALIPFGPREDVMIDQFLEAAPESDNQEPRALPQIAQNNVAVSAVPSFFGPSVP